MRAGRLSQAVTTLLLVGSCLALSMLAFGLLTGRFRALPVLSGSMEPSIEAGDLVIATPKPVASVEEGDVIVFHPPGESHLVVHRVVRVTPGVNGPVVRTKGDDNTRVDEWQAELQGATAWEVNRVIPEVGHAAVLAKQPNARLIAIGLAAIVFFMVTMRSIWATDDEGEGEGIEDAVAMA